MMIINKKINGALVVVMMAFVLLTFSSCSKKIVFNTSTVAPAARGFVKVMKDKNSNYDIEVRISNLAEVERLEGDKKTYVVWIVSDGQSDKNIGQINSSTRMMSKKLSASFKSVSPSRPSKIFVTAETDGAATYPGNMVILTTDNF